METKNLTEGSILGTLIRFAIPFLAANILQSLYGAVDLWVIGRYCPAACVAAVSTGTQVTQIVTSLAAGLTLGSTILVGEYMGRRQMELVKKSIGTALTVFAAAALLLTAFMIAFTHPLLMLLQTPEEAFPYAARYILVCSLGNIFICGYNAVSAVLRGCGDSKRPMVFVGISCVLNIILDIIFVRYLALNVTGTALATVLSQAFSMFAAVWHLKKNHFLFDFKPKSFVPDRTLAKKLARIGIPISTQELMIRISFLYLAAVMNRCGVQAAAIVGISSKYDVFAMLAAVSMANAIAAITAQNEGAAKPERARTSLWYALFIALCIASVFWLWAQLNPASMIRLFSSDPAIIAAGIPFFKSCSYDYIMVTFVFCLNGYLNGKQKTVWTMLSSCFGALILRIPLVYFFGLHFADNLGMLGRIAPLVSGIMAAYTLIYVLSIKNTGHSKTIG